MRSNVPLLFFIIVLAGAVSFFISNYQREGELPTSSIPILKAHRSVSVPQNQAQQQKRRRHQLERKLASSAPEEQSEERGKEILEQYKERLPNINLKEIKLEEENTTLNIFIYRQEINGISVLGARLTIQLYGKDGEKALISSNLILADTQIPKQKIEIEVAASIAKNALKTKYSNVSFKIGPENGGLRISYASSGRVSLIYQFTQGVYEARVDATNGDIIELRKNIKKN